MPIYVALGWIAVFVLPDLLAGVGVAGLVLLLAGGLLYTLGAICYALRRPDPWPRTFGYHELFHSATVLAAICHLRCLVRRLLTGGTSTRRTRRPPAP